MSDTSTVEKTEEETTTKDQLIHYHCGRCFSTAKLAGVPSVAFCGVRKTDWEEASYDDGACIVCRDYLANEVPCKVCGLIPRKGIPT